MDIIIVSIIIAAAALYNGNIFFQKFKVARSGKNGCGCSICPKGGGCTPAHRKRLKVEGKSLR